MMFLCITTLILISIYNRHIFNRIIRSPAIKLWYILTHSNNACKQNLFFAKLFIFISLRYCLYFNWFSFIQIMSTPIGDSGVLLWSV